MSRRAIPVLFALLTPSLAWAGGTAVVPPLVPKGVDAKVSNNATGLLSSELDFSGAFDTVNEIPAPASLNAACLTSTSCLQGIAKGAGADAVLAGSVGTGPDGWQVYLVLYDATKNTIKNKKTWNVAADNSALADNAGKWIKELVTGQAPAAAAAAEAPPAATFSADSEEDEFEFDKSSSKPASSSSSKSSTASAKTRIDTSAAKPRDLEDEMSDEDVEEQQAAAAAAAKARAEADARAKADAKAKADAEAKARAEAEARAKAEAQARAEAEARAKAEADARAKAEAARRAEQERLAREEEEREEQDRIAREEAAAKAKAAAAAKAKPAPAPAADEGDDLIFGSSAGLIAVEDGGGEPQEEATPAYRSSSSSSSTRGTSTASAKTTTSRSYDEDEDEDARPSRPTDDDEDLSADEDEDHATADEDEDLDLDGGSRSSSSRSSSSSSRSSTPSSKSTSSSSSSRSSSSSSRSSSSSSHASSSSRDLDLDGPSRGSSKSSAKLDRDGDGPQKPGVHVAGRIGYSNYYSFNFVTYGAEVNVPVATSVAIVAGVEFFSTQRHLEDKVCQKLMEDGTLSSCDPWNTILPINAGVVYKYPGHTVRPYGGIDLTATPYTADLDLAFGVRGRAGADFMLADKFGLNLNLSVGYMSGGAFDQTEKDVKNSGVIPQISGGTVIEF